MGIRLQLRVISRAAASFVPEMQTVANKYLKALCSAMGKPQTLQRFGLGNRSPEGRREKPMCTGAPRAALGLGLVVPLGSKAVAGGVVPGPGGTVAPITPGNTAGLPHGDGWWSVSQLGRKPSQKNFCGRDFAHQPLLQPGFVELICAWVSPRPPGLLWGERRQRQGVASGRSGSSGWG